MQILQSCSAPSNARLGEHGHHAGVVVVGGHLFILVVWDRVKMRNNVHDSDG